MIRCAAIWTHCEIDAASIAVAEGKHCNPNATAGAAGHSAESPSTATQPSLIRRAVDLEKTRCNSWHRIWSHPASHEKTKFAVSTTPRTPALAPNLINGLSNGSTEASKRTIGNPGHLLAGGRVHQS